MKKYTVLLLALLSLGVFAQETVTVNGVRDNRAEAYAFTNATIFTDYQTKLEGATLLIRDRHVEAVGKDIAVPDGYQVIDLKGKYVYPSFIDAYTTYGVAAAKRSPPSGGRRFGGGPEQLTTNTKGAYSPNQAIRAEFNAGEAFTADDKTAKSMRDIGFGTVLSLRADGIARGTSTVVTLGKDSDNQAMLAPKAAAHYSFRKGVSGQSYPSSMMGSVSLLRQMYLDAAWYAAHEVKPFSDQSLEAWITGQDLPQIFETGDWMSVARADSVGDEFGVQYMIKTGGDSYKRIDAVKATGASLIVPVNYPKAMDVDDAYDAQTVSLADMKHWELAPTNAGALEKAGIDFALTTSGLRPANGFMGNVRKAIKHGLSETAALKALTHNPAAMLKIDHQVGSLAPGKLANFLVTSGPVFKKETKIHDNWVQGHRYVLKRDPKGDHAGVYALAMGDKSWQLEISGEPGSLKAKIPAPQAEAAEGEKGDDADKADKPEKKGAADIKVNAKFEGDLISLSFSPEKGSDAIRLNGWKSGKDWVGQGAMPDGTWVSWKATYEGPAPEKDKDSDKADKGKKGKKGKDKKGKKGKKGKDDADQAPEVGAVTYPFLPYGRTEPAKAETILIKGATVWTNEDDGILQDTDVLVQDGKIAKVGKGLKAPKGATVVDGKDKHVTAGIIDEHSHIALHSVNDSATNSGMVRMNDVVDSEDIAIYRNLAGGVTAAQLLHGSANPIGGQSALIKMRWGSTPQEMLIEGADGFIKFALGENVKRSWNNASIRYPRTRMGVEQVFVDAFSAAVDYQKAMAAYNALSDDDKAKTVAPRRDLALDTMAEIIEGKRFITCHSYVQSEINMLMKVAEQFDFRVNTFTHILEGYKVADKMAKHGAGGSTFSDWWAYKWEVRYAIPYNTTLMHNEGVVVAVNSDDSEMSRRLNQEAAKSVKYGGMSEEDALKLVTLNPAKLLHLDDRTGSIKVGKDADLVVWSHHPLSIYAKAEKTLVDGKVLFDMETDKKLREEIRLERARLIAKLRKAKKGGGDTIPAFGRRPRDWHCDDRVDMSGEYVEVEIHD